MMLRTLVLATAAIAAALLHARAAMAAEHEKPAPSVSVSATGTVAVEPDIATITTGVTTEGDTAKDAIARNSATMAKLIAGLKGLGLDAGDIQTSSLNVEPRYTQPKDGRPATISGYRVSNQVRLTVREVKRLGDVLGEAMTLGVNQVHSIGFSVANAETVKDEARKQAMANARRRAELYASAAGMQVGQVLRISENIAGGITDLFALQKYSGRSVPIEPGTRTLAVEVHVTYALK